MRTGRADRLRFAMQQRGLVGVNELDRLAKLGAGWTSRFLDPKRPKVRPGPDTIQRVCDALRIRPEWLLHGKSPMDATVDGQSTPLDQSALAPAKVRTPTGPSLHPDIDAVVRLARNRKTWPLAVLFMADEIARERAIAPEHVEALLDQLEKELHRVKAAHMK